MKFSPLQLVRYIAPEFSCKAVEHFDPEKPMTAPEDSFHVKMSADRIKATKEGDRTLWTLELRIRQEVKPEQNFPYEFKIGLVGFFSFPDGASEDFDFDRFLKVNGSSILYGIAREILRSMTARGPWEEILLPTLSFYEGKDKLAAE